MNDLLSRLRTASIVVANLPKLPGYNDSVLNIDDSEAVEIALTIDDAVAALMGFVCIGVIDSEGDIYPAPPEAGTQVFIKTPNVELRGAPK